jgi:hypothetical protein
MFYRLLCAVALVLSSLAAGAFHVSGERIRTHVKYLARDQLEGRGVGTTGEKLATQYIASQLQAEGVQPGGDNGTYFQHVPLVGSTTLPSATLTISGEHRRVPLFVACIDCAGQAMTHICPCSMGRPSR